MHLTRQGMASCLAAPISAAPLRRPSAVPLLAGAGSSRGETRAPSGPLMARGRSRRLRNWGPNLAAEVAAFAAVAAAFAAGALGAGGAPPPRRRRGSRLPPEANGVGPRQRRVMLRREPLSMSDMTGGRHAPAISGPPPCEYEGPTGGKGPCESRPGCGRQRPSSCSARSRRSSAGSSDAA